MMDKSFIEKIAELGEAKLHEVAGKTYSDKDLILIEHDPRPATLEVSTLTAISDYMKYSLEKVKPSDVILHVESHKSVALLGPALPPSMKRTVFLKASTVEGGFKFGEFMDSETFIINMQVEFVPNEAMAVILKIIGNIKDERVINHSDSGVAQTVQVKVGVSLADNAVIPNPVRLKPWRTFREIEQPESTFIFRVRGGGDKGPPTCALFPAGGNVWKLDAIASIKEWIEDNVKDVPVLA